jgi:hypothetical protein
MPRPPLPARRGPRLTVPAIALAALAASGLLPGLLDALAYLLPPLLLLLALVARRYPGERALLALIAGRRRPVRGRTDAPAAARIRPRATVPRGGALIASSLAVRPPPARLAHS